ncbi:TIGR03643 family protein [Tenacibaculum aestuariivivum]|uniref:TIGR03643 family protein n=1 Tax=Tenacibaculum aestuariivivum TaxID=2006131 RepID=UPI003AB5C79A
MGKGIINTTTSIQKFTERELDRIIEMAWEDRTPFEAILFQFKLSEKDVIKLMRSYLKENSFKRWRKRVNSNVSKKHLQKRSSNITRFKCSRQKAISGNKISKR